MKNGIVFLSLLISCLLQSQIPNYVPLSGLQGYWPFFGNANDASPNNYNGVVYGPVLTFDRFSNLNSAYAFNGISDYISTAYAGVSGKNARAISFWAKTTNSVKPMSGVAWGTIGTAMRYEGGFNYGAPGPMIDGGDGAMTYSTPTAFNNNQWHHYVVQMESTNLLNQVQIFFDGVLLTTPSNVYNPNNLLITITGTSGSFPLQFGRLPGTHYFEGSLDDIGIWNRTLTKCEIQQLYKSSVLTVNVASSGSVCIGESQASATLSVLSPPAIAPYSYSWTPAVSSSSVASGLAAGSYSYFVEDSLGLCYQGGFVIKGIVCTEILSQSQSDEIIISPNPVKLVFTITGLKEQENKIQLFNETGIMFFEKIGLTVNQQLDISEVPSGLYYLKIFYQGNCMVRKLVVF